MIKIKHISNIISIECSLCPQLHLPDRINASILISMSILPQSILSTFNLIQNPNLHNQPWYAAINQQSIIIGNISRYLNANNTIQRITFTNKLNDSNNY